MAEINDLVRSEYDKQQAAFVEAEIRKAYDAQQAEFVEAEIRKAYDAQQSTPSLGELRRREGQGEIAAREYQPPGLGELRRREGQGEIAARPYEEPSVFPSDEMSYLYSQVPPETQAKITAGALRTVPPVIAGLATRSTLAMSATSAVGEALAQAVEKSAGVRPKINVGEITGAGAVGAVRPAAPAASIVGAFTKPIGQALAYLIAHTAGRIGGDWLAGDLKPTDMLTAAKKDIQEGLPAMGLGIGLGYGLPTLGAAIRTVADRPNIGNIGRTFAAELQAPLVAEQARRASETAQRNLQAFATTPEAKALVEDLSPVLAQHVRLDPKQMSGALAAAVTEGSRQPGDFVNNVLGALENSVGDLAASEKNAIRQFASVYQGEAAKAMAPSTPLYQFPVREFGGPAASAEARTQQRLQQALGPELPSPEADIAAQLVPGRTSTPGTPVSVTKASDRVKTAVQESLKDEKAKIDAAYAKVKKLPEMSEPQVLEPAIPYDAPGAPYGGRAAIMGPSINELLDERTKAFRAIDFGAGTKSGTKEAWQRLTDAQERVDQALDRLPAESTAKTDLLAANAEYKRVMSIYRTRFVDVVERETGEAGGKGGGMFASMKGAEGPTRLEELKTAAGPRWPQVKNDLAQVVYEDLAAEGPRKLVESVQAAHSGAMTAKYQPEVLKELLGVTPETTQQAVGKLQQFDQATAGRQAALALTDPTTFKNLEGVYGPEHLGKLKTLFGDEWNNLKVDVGQVLLEKLEGSGGPMELAKNIQKAYTTPGKAPYTREVLEEFFPTLNAAKANSTVAQLESAEKSFAGEFRAAVAKNKGLDPKYADVDSILTYLGKNEGTGLEFRRYMSSHAPGLLEDVQNRLLEKTIKEATTASGLITGDGIRQAAKTDNIAKGLKMAFGTENPEKINLLAETVDAAAAGAGQPDRSLLSKLALAGTGAIGKIKPLFNPIEAGSQAIMGASQGFRVDNLLRTKLMIKISQDPEIRRIMEKPFNDLSHNEKALLQARLPQMLQNAVR